MWVQMRFYLAYLAHGTIRHFELRLADPKFIKCHECEFHWPCTTLQGPIPFLAHNKSFTCIWGGQTFTNSITWGKMEFYLTIIWRMLLEHQSALQQHNGNATLRSSALLSSRNEIEMWINLPLFKSIEFQSMKCQWVAMHVLQGLANRILLSGKVIMINQHLRKPCTRRQMLEGLFG